LPNRRNVILTRNEQFHADGCEVVHTYNDVLKISQQSEKCFIIGGSELFTSFIDEVDYLYVTMIDEEFAGDTFFPEINMDKWELITATEGIVDEKNIHKHEFQVYKRK